MDFTNRAILYRSSGDRPIKLSDKRPYRRSATLRPAAWIALALIILAATGCADLASHKAENINANQDANRYDYFGWW